MAISQATALFSLLGTQYGGNGTSNFALPNLQGNAPMHAGSGAGLTPRVQGETGGETAVTLTAAEIPVHNHFWNCGSGSKGETSTIANNVNCDEAAGSTKIYAATQDGSVMGPGALQPAPASQPHQNTQPFQCVTFIIALQGVFPSRS